MSTDLRRPPAADPPAPRRVSVYGEDALLVEVADLAAVFALHAALRAQPVDGVIEVVPAARTLLVRLASGVAPDRVAAVVRGLLPGDPDAEVGTPVEIEVDYDGPDLAEVAARTGLTSAEVVSAHTGADLRVAFCGFAPGFGYLVGLPERLHVPRRDNPRTVVPSGSVGLAGEFTGVYPRESPGGWQLIGRTDAPLWDLDRDPPALLRPGRQVRFRAR